MTKKSIYLGVVFSILMTGLIFILGLDRKGYEEYPLSLYQVYLEGKVIGAIEDKEALYDLIDKEQESLKKEYGVDKIHPPLGLEVVEVTSYDEKTENVKDIYEKIKDLESFTIEGYEVTIKNEEEETKEKLYILNEEDLSVAIDNTIIAFLDEETLEKYRNGTQAEITDVGVKIEDVSIREEITVKETYIPTEAEIFTNATDLSRYLLFGTLETQETYSVVAGDTIKSVSDDHNLNVSELLIANPDIISANTLLFPGQELNIGLIDPVISVVTMRTSVQRQTIAHATNVKYDEKILVGTSYVEQVGIDGESRTTYKIESVNGQDTSAVMTEEEEIKPAVEEIVIKGGLEINYVGDSTYWAWPTIQPYVITSERGWRWGSWHNGVDIAGTGYDSPIFAIQSGVIIAQSYNDSMGNYIYIDHQNGYISVYMHMASFNTSLTKGSSVMKGQHIGGMGSTGFSTGTHLHLSVWMGGTPYTSGAYDIDPMELYR